MEDWITSGQFAALSKQLLGRALNPRTVSAWIRHGHVRGGRFYGQPPHQIYVAPLEAWLAAAGHSSKPGRRAVHQVPDDARILATLEATTSIKAAAAAMGCNYGALYRYVRLQGWEHGKRHRRSGLYGTHGSATH